MTSSQSGRYLLVFRRNVLPPTILKMDATRSSEKSTNNYCIAHSDIEGLDERLLQWGTCMAKGHQSSLLWVPQPFVCTFRHSHLQLLPVDIPFIFNLFRRGLHKSQTQSLSLLIYKIIKNYTMYFLSLYGVQTFFYLLQRITSTTF